VSQHFAVRALQQLCSVELNIPFVKRLATRPHLFVDLPFGLFPNLPLSLDRAHARDRCGRCEVRPHQTPILVAEPFPHEIQNFLKVVVNFVTVDRFSDVLLPVHRNKDLA